MHKLEILVINTRKWLFAVITMIITLSLGSWTLIESSDTAIAQTGGEGSEKTVGFNTSIIRLNENGTLSGFESDRQEIKGTIEQLRNQFPQVLKRFEEMSDRAVAEANSTVRNVIFINQSVFNQSAAVVIPYENVTEQTYMDEFDKFLKDIVITIGGGDQCWEVIIRDDGETYTVHATRCLGPA
jgi:hypothetical protein